MKHWCEALSRLMDPTDRSTCVLFGDGAGAAIFRLADTPFALTLGARGRDVYKRQEQTLTDRGAVKLCNRFDDLLPLSDGI